MIKELVLKAITDALDQNKDGKLDFEDVIEIVMLLLQKIKQQGK